MDERFSISNERLSTATTCALRAVEGAGGGLKFRGRLIQAGEARNVLDEPAGLFIPAHTLETAVALGQFNNLACFIDHAGILDGPSLRNLFGVWSGIFYNAGQQSVDGTLNIFDSDANGQIAAIFAQALAPDQPSPDIGVSIVFYGDWTADGTAGESGSRRSLTRFHKIESADLVFMPASAGSRILEALSAISNQQSAVSRQRNQPSAVSHQRNLQNQRKPRPKPLNNTQGEQFMPDQAKTPNPNPKPAADANPKSTISVSEGAKSEKTEFVVNPENLITPEFVELQNQIGDQWLEEIKQEGLRIIFDNADLPDVIKRRIMRKTYHTPEEVRAAIQDAHEELQELEAEETIELGQRPYIYVEEPRDQIRSHVEWFFGVPDAPLPPSNYRKLDQLYVAMTGDSEFHGVFRRDKVMFASADTSTLAGMAVDAMNKVVMAQMSHLQFWRWYEQLAVPIPNDGTVQDMKLITFGGVGDLPTVSEGAAYTELTVDDTKETAAFSKKGGYVGITLEMIRNSSIVEIQAVPKALAISAVRTRSAAISALFTSNSGVGPTLAQDSKALFHTDHNNVATTALGSDASAWRAARAECFNHQEVHSGKKLAVFPKFLLVPDDLYDQALAITGYGEGMPTTYTPEAQARNAADPRPIVVVIPDWSDANDWAYLVDPQIYPVIQISYAQSPGGGRHPAPELYSVSDENQGLLFTNDVLPIKVRDWFAVNVNGPRGIGKRNVA